MGKRDPRVDAYIKGGEFREAILTLLRAPCTRLSGRRRGDEVELSALHVQGHALQHGVVQGARRVRVLEGIARPRREQGRRGDGAPRPDDQASDLPSKAVLAGYIRKAVALNEQGVKWRARRSARRRPGRVPADVTAALRKTPARAVRGPEPESQARVPRVDYRGEDRGPARAAGAGDRVDGGG